MSELKCRSNRHLVCMTTPLKNKTHTKDVFSLFLAHMVKLPAVKGTEFTTRRKSDSPVSRLQMHTSKLDDSKCNA